MAIIILFKWHPYPLSIYTEIGDLYWHHPSSPLLSYGGCQVLHKVLRLDSECVGGLDALFRTAQYINNGIGKS